MKPCVTISNVDLSFLSLGICFVRFCFRVMYCMDGFVFWVFWLVCFACL
uniref:Transmembrane protein n=1 Tax=Podoviridae sp. ctz6O13 TaxID=2827757 RepID=A0A8S5TKV0_9CAUD|nr:MAG TPA: hypothetical protein [Podoviridae sp. ctz6O13]